MIDCDYKDKIISYIENELNNLEKAEFEIELQKNSELKEEYLEIKGLLNSLSSLPKLETSSDFMVSLNNRIDAYEIKKNRGMNRFFSNIFSGKFNTILGLNGNNYLKSISTVAMSLIFMFSLIYFLDFSSYDSSLTLSNSGSTNDQFIRNEVADLDSLDESSVIIDE